MAKRTCTIPGCDRPHNAKGLCATHYKHMQVWGFTKPLPPPHRKGLSAETRFFAKVRQNGDCWDWVAHRDAGDYGLFGVSRGVTVRAHRWAYEFLRASIPDGLQLDHLCRNRACVNPWHLEPVTPLINTRRAPSTRWRRLVCRRGHPMEGDNVHVDPKTGRRRCRTCRAARRRAARQRDRNSSNPLTR